MRSTVLLAIAALALPLVQAASVAEPLSPVLAARRNGGGRRKGSKTLRDDVISTGSTQTGQEPENNPQDGQVPSTTDDANFINFCSGQTITSGQQVTEGSCNPIPMGQMPSTSKMISTVITSPQNGDTLTAGQDFTVEIDTDNLITGFFTNPDVTYYSAPQQLNENGQVKGHAHLTIQNIGSLRSTQAPDPSQFAFFKGLNEAGSEGVLSAEVEGGLPAGAYRLCTLVSAMNHQPVLMPVAQRGAQDDCIRFEVTEDGGQDSAGGVFAGVDGFRKGGRRGGRGRGGQQ